MKTARLALALALALAAPAARAQAVLTSDLASGIPVGLAVPNTVAGADEATAVSVNPAGLGFVGDFTLQYFFQDGQAGSLVANGLYAALPIGPLVPALALEWMSPASGPRYLKTELALALALGQVVALGYGWNFYSSPDSALGALFDMDLGVTVRPARFLSLGASMLGFGGRIGGTQVPVRYDFGAALRMGDGLVTVAGDLYADDGGRGVFGVSQAAATATVSLPLGVALQGQYLFPLRSDLPAPRRAQAWQLALTWNQPHAGATVAGNLFGADVPDGSGMLYGARVSAERYRSRDVVKRVQVVDVEAALRPPSPLEVLLGAPRDRYAALLGLLGELERDPAVAAVLLEVGDLPVGLGRTEELRQAVRRVADRKPVLAWLSAMGKSKEYWLATAASEVYAAPGSVVVANGLSSTAVFLKDGLAKLGVAFEAVAVGRYKNAPDALTRSGPGEEQREVAAAILDARFELLVKDVAEARRLPASRVRELVDVGVFTAEEAKHASLLDGALWPDEVEKRARERAGGGVLTTRPDRSRPRAADRWGPRPHVALLRIDGAIAPGKSRREPFTGTSLAGADSLVRQVRAAASDPLAQAIVVRVESPGGDGFASDLVWRALAEARRSGKPVVVSMGDVAASGGYLVAVAADAIVAEPATLTGSIGAFALKPDLSGLLRKLGVNLSSEQRGDNARIDSFVKAWTADERKLVERQVRAFYDQFVARVAEGRGLPREEVERVAQGRVWTGEQAVALKLVDRLGGLEEALALAREKAGLDPDAEVRRLDPRPGFPGDIAEGLAALAGEPGPLQSLAARVPEVQAAALLAELGTVLALPVEWVDGLAAPGGGGSP
jgi:protease-4